MVRFRAAVADRAHWFVYTKVESTGLAPHRNNQRLYQGDLKRIETNSKCEVLQLPFVYAP